MLWANSREDALETTARTGDTRHRPELRRRRVALYSPGMAGIGHLRRNRLIAQLLGSFSSPPSILMIADARAAKLLSLPATADYLSLPSFHTSHDGRWRSRYLDIAPPQMVSLRANTIAAAVEAYQPDLLIVDHLPRGAWGELDSSLEQLRYRGRTRCVLGLRDVPGDATRVRDEWAAPADKDAIRHSYDAVWVYGDPAVFDPVQEYDFCPALAGRMQYTGYLELGRWPGAPLNTDLASAGVLPKQFERLMVCMAGAGPDGAYLAEAFALATFPPRSRAVVLMGPFMPPEVRQRLRRRSAENPWLSVIDFVADPEPLLAYADRIVAVAEYSTICDVLAFGKHALVVPSAQSGHEQQIRAERLRALGLLDVLPANDVSPAALSHWLARDLGPRANARERIDLNGNARLLRLLEETLRLPSAAHPRKDPLRRAFSAPGRAFPRLA